MAIPPGLKLSGSATIPAYYGGGPRLGNPWYSFGGLIGGGYQWESELASLSGVPSGQPVGTATFSWNLTPMFSNKHKHKKHKHKQLKSCLVPKLKGKTLAAAKHALKKAACSVGKISKHKSSKVPKGTVISSSPKAGTKHKAGAKVALTVSRGKH
jgi:hypothetical protein